MKIGFWQEVFIVVVWLFLRRAFFCSLSRETWLHSQVSRPTSTSVRGPDYLSFALDSFPQGMFFPEEFFPKEFFPRNGHFWRAVCCEGLASFLYVLIVSLAEAIVAEDISVPAATKWSNQDHHHFLAGCRQLHLGIVSGLAFAALTVVFLNISGAHIRCHLRMAKSISTSKGVTGDCGGIGNWKLWIKHLEEKDE